MRGRTRVARPKMLQRLESHATDRVLRAVALNGMTVLLLLDDGVSLGVDEEVKARP